jgi:hypothetical protein
VEDGRFGAFGFVCGTKIINLSPITVISAAADRYRNETEAIVAMPGSTRSKTAVLHNAALKWFLPAKRTICSFQQNAQFAHKHIASSKVALHVSSAA